MGFVIFFLLLWGGVGEDDRVHPEGARARGEDVRLEDDDPHASAPDRRALRLAAPQVLRVPPRADAVLQQCPDSLSLVTIGLFLCGFVISCFFFIEGGSIL